MRALTCGAFALVLAGCAVSPAAQPVPSALCPPVKDYSRDQEAALAQAIAALPPKSPLIGAMLDYGRLRAAARACAQP